MSKIGRKIHQVDLSVDEIGIIIEMTNNGKFRPEIARYLYRSTNTIWRYQKQFCPEKF